MNSLGIFFAILSPAIYAIINYFDKFFLEKFKINSLILSVYSGIIALFVSIFLILVFGLHKFSLNITVAIIFSGFLIELYLLPYFRALSLDDASTIVPLMQFTPIFVMIGDAIILKEALTATQYIGAGFIIVSGVILSAKKINSYIFKPRKAFWLMILAGMCTALSVLLFKYGASNQDFWLILPYESFGIFLCSMLALFYRKNYKIFITQTKNLKKSAFLLMFLNEGIYILARYLGLFALSLISASLVSVLAGIQPFFALMYGVILSLWFPFILKEVITKKNLLLKISAIMVIIVGIILITLTS